MKHRLPQTGMVLLRLLGLRRPEYQRQNQQTVPQRHKNMKGRVSLVGLLILWTALLFSTTVGHAETYVSGAITQDTTWTLAGSPYIVTGDVFVRGASGGTDNTATLTIEPGVEVRFNAVTGLYVGVYHDHWGALFAQGTEAAPIIFTSNADSPAPGDWKGVYFTGYTDDAATILEHCVIEYGGATHNANVYIYGTSPTIKNSTIRYSSMYGIYCEHTSSQPVIIDNIISNNGESPINTHPDNVKDITGNSGSDNGKNYIEVRGGNVSFDCTWVKQAFAYVITGDVFVRGASGGTDNTATLTIEPGVEVRFNAVTGLYVGVYHDHWGALFAQGTEAAPIIFTSNADSPAPGDWKGVYFTGYTDDAATFLEKCVVEYGGDSHNADIYLYHAKPTIQYNTIRNSSHSGIYVYGTGCNAAAINCNNLKDNLYGVYTAANAQPLIHNNNFLRNMNYGVYNAGSVSVDATDNWWGDENGPGYSGDDIYGDVDYTPWLTAESNCITAPPTNSPPFVPKNPTPANAAVKVQLTDGSITLSWVGGDPNPWDTVTYDVYFGTSAEDLAVVAQNIDTLSYGKDGLDLATTYYWRIIARDDGGLETVGPVWHFITQGPPPDLVVTAVTWEPASNIGAGSQVTFTATVENNGAGPAVDPFQVDFRVDGASIGSQQVSQILLVGESVLSSQTWTAEPGEHTIEVVADSTEAVAESDEANNSLSQAMPPILDTIPPEDVTNLHVQCFETRLVFSWDHSANTYGDLAGYRVYFNNDTVGVSLPSTQNTYERTGLSPASSYPFRITAYDAIGNESSGVSLTGVTLLQNPANLSVTPYSGYVDLAWDGVEPSQYVKLYAIYVDDTDFSTVEGMTPRARVTGTSGKLAGLTNNSTYYFAVTAVNVSDCERKEVSTVSATPVPDTQGPAISDIKLDDVLLADGAVLNESGTFTLYVTDPASLSRVEFYVDGILYHTDSNGSNNYSCFLEIVSLEDGEHTLTITAYDTLGNSTNVTYTLVVALAPPSSAPTITQPVSGTVVNTADITVSGQAEKYREIILYNNNAETGASAAVDANGNFSLPLTLTEGENRIQAAARNRVGTGPRSAEVLVTLDTSIPQSPTSLSAQAKPGGVIKLTWQKPLEASVKGYNLYRATSGFSLPGEATKVNTNLITATSFNDLTPEDGTYYYRVSTVDTADNESGLSGEAFAQSDSVLPRAVSIQYTPTGPYDEATGRMAPGLVNLLLTVSEPLQATPFLTITPGGGVPISVDLTRTSDLAYSGFFVIADTIPTGTAYAVFSGRDLVGNRGTEIDAGGTIRIDTDGPAISHITIEPVQPIRNDENDPVSVTVTIGLNEVVKAGETPALSYFLSAEERSEISIEPLTQVTAEPGQAQAWQGTFLLPVDAGLTEVETLHFVYQGIDDLGNVNSTILCDNLFQIYQGDLPPLAPPEGLTGQSLPEGKIKLSWNAVEGTVGYQLYRQAPGEGELTAYERLETVLEFVDEPSSDGLYVYAIASIRQDNEQESISGMSAPVEVASDSVSPGSPQNLALELEPSGINAEWEAPPSYTEPVTYSLYRANLPEITSVEGLTPVVTGITETMVIDPHPSPTDHSYVVTAVDNAGNESLPSNSFYLNFDLLPVSALSVLQTDNASPVISWTHPGGSIVGYNIYLGPEGGTVKLNQNLLTGLSYTDTGYAEDERRYTVTAVDNNDHESLGRAITLPLLRATLAEGSQIKRGIMNRLDYVVENLSSAAVGPARLRVRLNGRDHLSESFSLQPLTSNLIPVIVGGYADLPDLASLTTTIEVTPNMGEKVEIVRTSEIEVGDGMLALEILNEEFTRGGTGKVQFTLENTCDEEIEIVTATGSGLSPSDEITFYLLDADGNVLSSEPFKQNLGEGIVTLANGQTVARIPAGSIFTSQFLELPVPLSSPDEVIIKLEIAQIYFHLGRPDQVSMGGLSTRHEISLIDTAYYGEVLSITPESSNGDEDIVITGQAVERDTGSPMPDVPLDLVISVNGFERTYEVFTGADGSFSFTFTPLAGESGLYNVRAVHPDLLDRPVQGQFVINRISITPAIINLSIPRNYEKEISIQVGAGDGTAVTNLRLIYDELDQPAGAFPDGVHVTIGSPIAALGSEETASLDFSIWADNSAEETGRIILKVKSDETGQDSWGSVIINTHFSDAQPALYFSPDHVETGVAFDDTVSETVILENRGVADLNDVSLAIVSDDGTPAPDWVHLNTDTDQGVIAIGQTREVPVAFSPASASTAEGMYLFYLRVASSNYPTTDIALYVSVTQSGIGSVLFKVANIYTGTVDQNNEIIQGLAGAKIKVQNEEVLTVEQTQTTDTMGEVLFSDLPSGRYKCRITADNHQEYIGRLWIKPGVTVSKEVFLSYNLVTVEWEVVETTIEDKYEIVLSATYETDVPAAVVVAEPSSITLPDMKAGDVYYGEFTLTNYGLIRAKDLNFALPEDDNNFKYELLTGVPDSLEAKDRITVPYKVTCLNSPAQEESQGTGGGSGCYLACIHICYLFECMYVHGGEHWFETRCTTHCVLYGECGGRGGGGGIGGGAGGAGGVGGGGDGAGGGDRTWSPSPAPEKIGGVICWPVGERKEFLFDLNLTPFLETQEDILTDVGCTVNNVLREFNDDAVDLSVKVPGGSVTVQRRFHGRFYGNEWRHEWQWEHIRNNLRFNWDPLGQFVESIDKGGVIYEKSSTVSTVYTHDTYRITEIESGYIWKDKIGNWKEYDLNGRMTSYGSRSGVVGKLLYEEGENGRLIGIADRNDRQVIWFEYDTDDQVSAVQDNDNRRVEYSYTDARLTQAIDVLGNETTYEYDSDGRITIKVDAGGRPTIVSYDENYGNVAQVVDQQGNGHFFQFDYDEVQKEYYAQIKTSSGMVKEVWYDRDGETTRVDINGRTIKRIVKDRRNLIITDEKGNITQKEFDEWENLTRVVYPDGFTVSFEYEHTFNQIIRATDPRRNVTEHEYDDQGNLIKRIEAVGTESERVTTYAYDEYGQLLTATIEGDANTETATTTFTYDENGNLASINDPEGNTTEFLTYDNVGNLLEMRDARGNTWAYAYDDAGRLTSQTDPLGNSAAYEYDGANNRTAIIKAYLKRFDFEYDDHNNLIKAIDPYEKYRVNEYNTDNLVTRTVDQEGRETSFEYDNEGRLIKITDGAGNETVYQYDESLETFVSSYKPVRIDYPTYSRRLYYDKRQRVIRETDILDENTSQTKSYTYDAAGNLLTETDAEGNTTQYEYDALNRLVKTTDSLGGIIERTYDDRGNLIVLKDPNNGITRYEYDRNNRLVKMIRPMGEETVYEYDATGNRTAVLDGKGQKISYEYDELNRLIRARYFAAGDHTTPVKTVEFTYDKLGNLISYNDGITLANYTYDDLQRKTDEAVNYGSFTLSYSYTYYANGMKKSFTGPDGITYDYLYDANNRISSIAIPGQGQITYNTYQWNSPDKITLPGGTTSEYTYDPLMQLKSIAVKDPAQNPFMAYNYEYSPAGNITSKNTEHGNYAYQYDELYRLIEATNPTIADEAYTYDAIGNRLTAAAVEGTWGYNDNNELLGYGDVAYVYDNNGNMTRKISATQVSNYIYDIEDRLVRVEDGDGSVIVEYYYDPFGRRLWKEVGGIRTYFFYSDEGLSGEYDASGNEIKTYGYAPDSTWTTDPLFQSVGGIYYWYQNDHLGTPQKIVDTSGRTVWSTMYDAFGSIQIGVAEIENNIRFPGQYYDAETGLYYNRNRYYDPVIGRYLRLDPLGKALNLYTYVLGNPVNLMDPWGLCEKERKKPWWKAIEDWFIPQASAEEPDEPNPQKPDNLFGIRILATFSVSNWLGVSVTKFEIIHFLTGKRQIYTVPGAVLAPEIPLIGLISGSGTSDVLYFSTKKHNLTEQSFQGLVTIGSSGFKATTRRLPRHGIDLSYTKIHIRTGEAAGEYIEIGESESYGFQPFPEVSVGYSYRDHEKEDVWQY